jgi:hypothetical protein
MTALQVAGLLGSKGSIGDCYDNSVMHSFWGTMQLELLDSGPGIPAPSLRNAVFEWIECWWHNPKRRHSSIGMLSPVHYEAAPRAPRQDRRPHTVGVRSEGPTSRTTAPRSRAPVASVPTWGLPPKCPSTTKSEAPGTRSAEAEDRVLVSPPRSMTKSRQCSPSTRIDCAPTGPLTGKNPVDHDSEH